MGHDALERWVRQYLAAWASDDPDEIAALFTEDAEYHTGPFDEPWEGREKIVREWIARGDSDAQWEFDWSVVAFEDGVGVVQGHTVYTEPDREYSNIWLVRLAGDGRAREYREWWVAKKT